MRAIGWVFFLWFLTLSSMSVPAGVLPARVDVARLSKEAAIGEQVELIEDPGSQFDFSSIQSIPEADWKSNTLAVLPLGYSRSTWWVRLTLNNSGPISRRVILQAGWPLLDWLDVAVVESNQIVQRYATGDQRAFDSRPLPSRDFSFPLELKPGASQIVFMRLALKGGVFDTVPLRLMEVRDYEASQQMNNLILGGYFGVVVSLLTYNLLLFRSTRDRNFLNYALFLGAFCLWMFGFKGYGFQYLWPHQPWINNLFNLIIPAPIHILSTVFVTGYLETRSRLPTLHWLMIALAILVVLCVPFAVAEMLGFGSVPITATFYSYTALSLLMALCYLLAGAILLWRGFKPAKYFMLAWSCLIIGIVVYQLSAMPDAHLPSNLLTENSLNIGSGMEMLLLALALGEKYRQLAEDRFSLKRQALDAQLAYSSELEQQVKIRTQELQANTLLLQESEERFRKLFEDTRQPLALMEEGRFTSVNQATLDMMGMGSDMEFIGRSLASLSPERQPDGESSSEKAKMLMRRVIERGSHEFDWELRRVDGVEFPVVMHLTAIERENGHVMHVVMNDVTEQRKASQKIHRMAYHDALTGLPNRLLGQDRLRHEVTSAQRRHHHLAVLYLDMDKFKYINDTHGHAAGDLLLQGFAQRLLGQLRAEDTLCRLSGDEFMVLLPELQSDHVISAVSSTCERLLSSLAEPFDLDGVLVSISFSIGVAIYPQDGEDGESLMRHADTALYEVKRKGVDGYCFFEAHMNEELKRFVEVRSALRQAIELNEFELYFQPKIDLNQGHVVGAEALIRWNRAGEGVLLPDTFIEVAEESGLIVELGRWVLKEACRQAAVWRDKGWQHLVLAVNLSAIQFRQSQVREDVMSALEASGLPPSSLELELTESTLFHQETLIIDNLDHWKAMGIHISIDDFGTGYSNLGYLKRFKADKLKIDRSFVSNLLNSQEDRAIVTAIIQIARSLGLRTIAEGVDDATLANELRFMGCNEAQGYLYSRPLPAREFEQWLQRYSADIKSPEQTGQILEPRA